VQSALSRLREAEDDMRRAVDQRDAAGARSAAEQLREAMGLLGGTQQRQAQARVDAMAQKADRLAAQMRAQTERLRGTQRGGDWQSRLGGYPPGDDGSRERDSMIEERQRLADELARLTQEMRGAEREMLSESRDAASKLRDALNELDEADAETRLQRSADLLRRGYNPATGPGEEEIGSALSRLGEQLRDVRQALASGKPPTNDALDQMDRFRARLADLDRGQRGPGGPGRQQGEAGARAGVAGPVTGGPARGGYRDGPVYGGWNAGNNLPLPNPVAPDLTRPRPDPQETYRQGMSDLSRLRQSIGEDPELRREVDELIRSMQKLDPKRFPGNPAMVDELYARVLTAADKLELQLRRDPDGGRTADVRSEDPLTVPAGYQAAVADYFRRLSKNP
jgi:hypothetical protein